MKAWEVRKKQEFCATVVFAKTKGKAKSLALCTDCCEDSNFLNIEVRRAPQMDKYYKDGKVEMDWFNAQDRIALVKDCGFSCEYHAPDECKSCTAKEFCSEYKGE